MKSLIAAVLLLGLMTEMAFSAPLTGRSTGGDFMGATLDEQRLWAYTVKEQLNAPQSASEIVICLRTGMDGAEGKQLYSQNLGNLTAMCILLMSQ